MIKDHSEWLSPQNMILDLNTRVIQSTEYDIRFKYQSDSVHQIWY